MKSFLNTVNPGNSVIADTGFWVAIGARNDQFHDRAIRVARSLTLDPVTTWPVVTETTYLLQRMQGTQAVDIFLQGLEQSGTEIFQLQTGHLGRIRQLMNKYTDLPMDLADASLVVLAEALGHGRILSTDQRDFHAYRWKNHHPFENLLLADCIGH